MVYFFVELFWLLFEGGIDELFDPATWVFSKDDRNSLIGRGTL